MSESGPALACRECRAARRLSRLFRIERHGSFDRRPATIASKLIERRAALIADFTAMDRAQRHAAAQPSPELDRALVELAAELVLSRERVIMRLQQIGNDLRLSRGESLPSGIRNSASGHSLGKT